MGDGPHTLLRTSDLAPTSLSPTPRALPPTLDLSASAAAHAHLHSTELGVAALSRRSNSPLPSAVGRSSHISRRRRARLRDGSSERWIHDWSLSLPNSPPNSPTLASHCKVATSVGGVSAANGEEGVKRAGDVLMLARGGAGDGGEGHRQPPRRNRRQRRRQRLRLRSAFGEEVGVQVAEEEALSLLGIESNIVEAGSLDMEAAVGQDFAVGAAAAAAAAGSAGSELSGAEAASGEVASAGCPSSVSSGIGGWRLPEEVARSSPPVHQAVQEAGLQGGAAGTMAQGRSSAVVDELRAEDERFMRMALRLAKRARMEGEVPVRERALVVGMVFFFAGTSRTRRASTMAVSCLW